MRISVVSLCNLVRRYSRGKIANRDNMIISGFVLVICLYLKSAADATSKSAEINTNHGSSLSLTLDSSGVSGHLFTGHLWRFCLLISDYEHRSSIRTATAAGDQVVLLSPCPHPDGQDSIELLQDLSHCRGASLTSYFQLTTFVQRYYIQWSISIQNGTYFLIIKDISFHRLKVWQFLFPKFKH